MISGWTVYTDGCCFNNGGVDAQAGWACFWGAGHIWNTCGKVSGRQTNNVAELTAVLEALQKARLERIRKLKVCTDSEYIINTFTRDIWNWKRNNWQTTTGPVRNRGLIQEIDDLLEVIEVDFYKIRAHRRDSWNEAVDRMAKEAASAGRKLLHFASFNHRNEFHDFIYRWKDTFYYYSHDRGTMRRNAFLDALEEETNRNHDRLIDEIPHSVNRTTRFNFCDFIVAAMMIERKENFEIDLHGKNYTFFNYSQQTYKPSNEFCYRMENYHRCYRGDIENSVAFMCDMAGI